MQVESSKGNYVTTPPLHCDGFIGFCNECRTYYSLDIGCAGMPTTAQSRDAADAIRKNGPKWTEMDTND